MLVANACQQKRQECLSLPFLAIPSCGPIEKGPACLFLPSPLLANFCGPCASAESFFFAACEQLLALPLKCSPFLRMDRPMVYGNEKPFNILFPNRPKLSSFYSPHIHRSCTDRHFDTKLISLHKNCRYLYFFLTDTVFPINLTSSSVPTMHIALRSGIFFSSSSLGRNRISKDSSFYMSFRIWFVVSLQKISQ